MVKRNMEKFPTGLEKLPTQDEVKEAVGKLEKLLMNPRPWLMTWCEARYRLMSELHRMLGEVLEVMDR